MRLMVCRELWLDTLGTAEATGSCPYLRTLLIISVLTLRRLNGTILLPPLVVIVCLNWVLSVVTVPLICPIAFPPLLRRVALSVVCSFVALLLTYVRIVVRDDGSCLNTEWVTTAIGHVFDVTLVRTRLCACPDALSLLIRTAVTGKTRPYLTVKLLRSVPGMMTTVSSV